MRRVPEIVEDPDLSRDRSVASRPKTSRSMNRGKPYPSLRTKSEERIGSVPLATLLLRLFG
jgi:hypothetical protein